MAVYTNVSFKELALFLKNYDVGDLVSFSAIVSGVQNSNYLIETSTGKYILTLYETLIDKENLPYFLNLMTHLKNKNIPCPLPVQDKQASALNSLCGKKACLTTFLLGASVFDIKPPHCQELGLLLAKMHEASFDFPSLRKNELSVQGYRALFEKIGKALDEITKGLYEEVSFALQDVETNFPKNLPQAVIHADLFPDNVFFDKEKLSGVIDFYFACNDFMAYDLAVCLNAWCFDVKEKTQTTPETHTYNKEKARALFLSYNKIRPFTALEKQAFPILAKAACLRFLLTRCYDWLNQKPEALVIPKNPMEYLEKLRFHTRTSRFESYE